MYQIYLYAFFRKSKYADFISQNESLVLQTLHTHAKKKKKIFAQMFYKCNTFIKLFSLYWEISKCNADTQFPGGWTVKNLPAMPET